MSSHILPRSNNKETAFLYNRAIKIYQQTQWLLDDDPSSSESDVAHSFSGDTVEPVLTGVLIRKVRIYTECLVEIGDSLGCPATDDLNAEEPTGLGLEQRSAEDYHTERLRAKFPLADYVFLQAFGGTCWDRYQRMQRERELNVRHQLMTLSNTKSHAVYSEFRDSGLGTSNLAATSPYAATILSFLSSVAGGKHIKIPSLSAEAKAGSEFECIACSRFIQATNERDWRYVMHLACCVVSIAEC